MIIACTPTRNRRWALEFSVACMKQQIVKPDIWIVYDNSDTPEQSWKDIETMDFGIPIVYVIVPIRATPIGAMRNKCMQHALKENAEYILFWDDDDYYPPQRIEENIRALEKNALADISGSSTLHLLLTRENVLMTTGPFHERHGTAATFCIRSSYAKQNTFDDTKEKGEEITFTKEWKANLVQVDNPETMIVVMGHARNTVDKSDLLRRPSMYNAKIMNQDNGCMAFRARWNPSPEVWGLMKQTFFA
jgi:glycosyltransferase involved in cell wall biosynthesis